MALITQLGVYLEHNGLKLDYVLVTNKEKKFVNIKLLQENFGSPVYDSNGYLTFKYRGY